MSRQILTSKAVADMRVAESLQEGATVNARLNSLPRCGILYGIHIFAKGYPCRWLGWLLLLRVCFCLLHWGAIAASTIASTLAKDSGAILYWIQSAASSFP